MEPTDDLTLARARNKARSRRFLSIAAPLFFILILRAIQARAVLTMPTPQATTIKHLKNQLKKRPDGTLESEDLVPANTVGVAMLVCLAEISAIGFAVAKT